MPIYKLTYFNAAAVAEPIRWIFKYAEVPFEDERIEHANWPKEKSRFPLGQIPIVRENGNELTQSGSMIRYLGKKHGLATGDEFLDYRVDQVMDIVTDIRLQWAPAFFESDPEKKKEKLRNVLTENFPKILKQLTSIVEATNSEGPFIAGKKVTYGDFQLAHWLSIFIKTVSADLLKDYPILSKQMEAVYAIPQIKKWVAERPVTAV